MLPVVGSYHIISLEHATVAGNMQHYRLQKIYTRSPTGAAGELVCSCVSPTGAAGELVCSCVSPTGATGELVCSCSTPSSLGSFCPSAVVCSSPCCSSWLTGSVGPYCCNSSGVRNSLIMLILISHSCSCCTPSLHRYSVRVQRHTYSNSRTWLLQLALWEQSLRSTPFSACSAQD